MVKQNIGIINSLVRITAGLTMLAWSTAKLSRKPHNQSYLVVAMLGAMKVGEGITRYCPVTAMIENQNGQDSASKDQQEPVINPT